ncbi:hypothetical protein VZ95_06960 [Elstera litoralis]|uniref:Flagellar hook protein FlgE n=1 Tax=Elstera litoralis TaxID=552518 RepID=A0A0F3IX17_9PROT|nr:flagellar hook-basal body complex protein [Elstera litoralis]KJV10134.1 hypothetical protein VZ95_06960 [Elstera litoralis]
MMSFSKALITGVTAMNAQSTAMGVLSNNIANSRTVGFKDSDSRFSDLVNGGKSSNSRVGSGVVASQFSRIDQQGILSASYTSTNFAIAGRGFFPVASAIDSATGQIANTAERLVTRAGDFSVDKNGFLVNSKGFALLGIPAGTTATTGTGAGAFNSLQPIKVPATTVLAGTASTSITLTGNLSAADAVPVTTTTEDTTDADGNVVPGTTTTTPGATVTSSVTAYDSTGTPYVLEVTLTKTAPQTWTAQYTGGTGPDGTALTATATSAPITLTFGSNGQLVSPTGSVSLGSVAFTNTATGASVATLSPNFKFQDDVSGLTTITGMGGASNLSGSTTDGHGALGLAGIEVGEDGVLYQIFDQGKRVAVASIPVVTFVNDYGLESVSGTAYRVTDSSGDAVVNASNTNGAGKVMGAQLEQSTVDLADEFTDMIVTQRGYQAASKIVTTADAMIEIVRDLKN